MKLNFLGCVAVTLLKIAPCVGFVVQPNALRAPELVTRSTKLQMSFVPVVDFSDSVSSLMDLSSLILSDESVAAAADAASDAAASSGNGFFGFLTLPIEYLLQLIHSVLVGVGVEYNAWGVSILMMTVVIKLLTFPLTKTQLESTNKMQVLAPRIEEIKSQYGSNAEVMNQKIADLYQTEQVNPLAGCIPSLIQLPIFIGLYRAVLDLAKENKLNEPFLWLPNLEGPVYGADPSKASDWILKGWENGAPSLGWHDTFAFLSLPVILVVSQFITQQIMNSQTPDNQQQNNIVLKLLPLLIGWFAVNVPAALGIYWVANNILTTAFTMQIKSSLATVEPSGASSATISPPPPSPTFISKLGEKPSGFSKPSIDAEIVDTEDIQVNEDIQETVKVEAAKTTANKKRGKKRRKRKN